MKIKIKEHCIKHLTKELNSKGNCNQCQRNLINKKQKLKNKSIFNTYEYNRRKTSKKYSLTNIFFNNNIYNYYNYLILSNIKKECKVETNKSFINLTKNKKILISLSKVNIFNEQCKIHNIFLINYLKKENECLGCLYWNNNFCKKHQKNITQKNKKCHSCINNISNTRRRKSNEKYQEKETKRKQEWNKGELKEIFLDIETTTDKILENLIPKFDKELNKIKDNEIRQELKNGNITVPENYMTSICHIEKYGNLIDKKILTNHEEILDILKITNNFNAEYVQHCTNSNCKWKNIAHWRYSFYSEFHLALFLITYCLTSIIWTQNGSKFDNSFIKRMFDRIGLKQFYDYNFGQSIFVLNNFFNEKLKSLNEEIEKEKNNSNKLTLNETLEDLKKQKIIFETEVKIWKNFYDKKEKEFDEYVYKLSKRKQEKFNDKKEKKEWIKKHWMKNIDLSNYYNISRDGKNRYMRFIIYGNEQYITTKKNQHVKRNRSIKFADINLIFPSSLKQKGNDLAKAYKIKGMQDSYAWMLKKEISNNHKQYKLYKSNKEMLEANNGKDLAYAYRDTFILMMFLIYLNEEFKINYKKWQLTAGATAYKTFITEYGKLQPKLNKKIKLLVINSKTNYYKYSYKDKIYTAFNLGKLFLEKIMPTKWMKKEIHINIRQWYRGGLTLVNEKFRGVLVQNATYIDINSSYPSVMNSNMICPIGIGYKNEINNINYNNFIKNFKEENNIKETYCLLTIIVLKEIKNKKGLPFVTDISGKYINVKFNENNEPITKFNELSEKNAQYLKRLLPNMKLNLDSNEYERFKKYYSNKEGIDYKININWIFEGSYFNSIFGSFINIFFNLKEKASKEGNLAIKIWAKLFLNSLYGKFATKFMITNKIVIRNNEYEVEHENEKKFYLPIGIAITAGARMKLVDACDINYNNFIYCDTDSMIINYKESDISKFFSNIKLDNYKLGYWSVEDKNLTGICRRAKQYLFVNTITGKIKSAFAGFHIQNEYIFESEEELEKEWNKELTITFTDMINGKLILNQIYNYSTCDFVMLYNHDKILQNIANYEPLFEQTKILKEDFKDSLKTIKWFETKWLKENKVNFWNWVKSKNKKENNKNIYKFISCI